MKKNRRPKEYSKKNFETLGQESHDTGHKDLERCKKPPHDYGK